METLSREVVALFFKDASKRVWLNSLVVLQEIEGTTGAYVRKEFWDVDYSKKFGYIYHMSGAGGDDSIEVSGLYHSTATFVTKKLLGIPIAALDGLHIVEKPAQWVDARDEFPFDNQPRTQAIRKRNRTRRIGKLPKVFYLQPGHDLLDWLHRNAIEGDSVWCSTCKDVMPGGDCDLCEHVWWCDKTGDYSTPNSRCECEDREECRE
jgi:hypothetical protein